MSDERTVEVFTEFNLKLKFKHLDSVVELNPEEVRNLHEFLGNWLTVHNTFADLNGAIPDASLSIADSEFESEPEPESNDSHQNVIEWVDDPNLPQVKENWVTLSQAASMLGVSHQRVNQIVDALGGVKDDRGHWLFPEATIKEKAKIKKRLPKGAQWHK